MSNKDIPAFPRSAVFTQTHGLASPEQDGMTLRDYFAAKAMQENMAILANTSLPDWNGEIARLSYLLADAMMKAREQ